jgi:hypothetical protein
VEAGVILEEGKGDGVSKSPTVRFTCWLEEWRDADARLTVVKGQDLMVERKWGRIFVTG